MPETTPHRHVVMMSSGAGSWAAAKRVAAKHGTENMVLLFADVKGDNPSEHAGEDEDNYRFLKEAAANVGAPLVWLVEGRDIWQVFDDEHMLGNNRVPVCSRALKQRPTRAWVEENCDIERTTIYLGLDWDEDHRLPGNTKGWAPWPVEYPMTEEPLIDKAQVLDWMRSEGIEPPQLYARGHAHANCGGFCCQAGQADNVLLLRTNPERYRYHEDREQAFRDKYGKDVAFMADRRRSAVMERLGLTDADVERVPVDPEDEDNPNSRWIVRATGEPLPGRVPLTMKALRERVEADPTLFDSSDRGPCACFPFAEADPGVSVTLAPRRGKRFSGEQLAGMAAETVRDHRADIVIVDEEVPPPAEVMAYHRWRNNAHMIAEGVRPLYLPDDAKVCDPLYGKGNFWTQYRPPLLVASDLDPLKSPHPLGPLDAEDLPYDAGSFDVTVLDFGYKLNGTPDEDPDGMDAAYGVSSKATVAERHQHGAKVLVEGARITRAGGLVMFKCMDQVSSGRKWWQTRIFSEYAERIGLRWMDEFVIITNPRPQPSGRGQKHTRSNGSSLLVFKVGRKLDLTAKLVPDPPTALDDHADRAYDPPVATVELATNRDRVLTVEVGGPLPTLAPGEVVRHTATPDGPLDDEAKAWVRENVYPLCRLA